jgi:hypothetical protein
MVAAWRMARTVFQPAAPDRVGDRVVFGLVELVQGPDGENIYLREIEDVLFTHPGVLDVAVVGVPDEVWGEQVAAVPIDRLGQDPETPAPRPAYPSGPVTGIAGFAAKSADLRQHGPDRR